MSEVVPLRILHPVCTYIHTYVPTVRKSPCWLGLAVPVYVQSLQYHQLCRFSSHAQPRSILACAPLFRSLYCTSSLSLLAMRSQLVSGHGHGRSGSDTRAPGGLCSNITLPGVPDILECCAGETCEPLLGIIPGLGVCVSPVQERTP